MKKLPIGIQNLAEIINGGYLYVDKTETIFRMITNGKYYFYNRPRRFGKSLTVSTIEEIYRGNKELFKELFIEDKWDWEKVHPVIHISFNEMGYKDSSLAIALLEELNRNANTFQIELTSTGNAGKFRELIEKTHKKIGKVVILIDEYDKPIIDYLDDLPKAEENREILRSFYSVLKSADPHLELLFMTGISKFSQVSIFSELNNLDDIGRDWRYPLLTGYTQEEIEQNFGEHIQQISQHFQITEDELLEKLKFWYNGYTWDMKNFVYNPFSILSFFAKAEFNNYWFQTGTPTFLIKLMTERREVDLENFKTVDLGFDSYSIKALETIPLLLQTGYLTLKSKDKYGIYTLGYPNQEVKESMLKYLIGGFTNYEKSAAVNYATKLRLAFLHNDMKTAVSIINTLFKNIPSHIFIKEAEAYYHSVVFLLFKYLGTNIDAEVHTSDGRIAAVVKTETHIYIVEFKLDKSADEAMQQIHEKDYPAKFENANKKLVALGINFNSQEKAVDDWKLENLS